MKVDKVSEPVDSFSSYPSRLSEVTVLFLRLGITAFGGPAAHIAIMHDEVVTRRKWVSEQEFLDLLGAANLIPGPTSTELAIYLGFKRVGWAGLLLAGACFILPAALIVTGLAWAYVRYGSTPSAAGIFRGILPVVIAIVAQALWNLGRRAVKSWLTGVIGLAVFGLYFLGVNLLVLLLAAGLIATLGENFSRRKQVPPIPAWLPLVGSAALAGAIPFSRSILFLNFLKVGATLYGSGYVLLAYLQADFVRGLGWLTDKQLIDAIAIGQVTPGPVFTTATFIGYLLGGLPGAVLATLGIFLPSFVFVGAASLVINRLRNSPWTAGFIDGVNAASLGLMLGVTLQLAAGSSPDVLTILVFLAALFFLLRYRLNSTWLIVAGALIGLARTIYHF